MLLRLAFTFAIGLLTTKASYACSPAVVEKGYVPPPISVKNDCSFHRKESYWSTKGQAALAIGNQRISQVIGLELGTAVIVSDCTALETVTIFGKDFGEASTCGQPFEIESHIKPEGHFDLAKGNDLLHLATKAKRRGFQVVMGISHLNRTEPVNRQIDAFCGCKIFYPNSAGAVR